MQKHLLTILLTLFSHSVIAQTSYDEPELDFKALDKDVKLICLDDCKSQFNFNLVSLNTILKYPVGKSARVVSDYGWRMHPVLKRKRFHQGVDFSVPIGTPVQAGESGTVVYAGWMRGYGKLIVIKHDSSFSTVYGHLNSFSAGIEVGSHVKRGQIIAESGNTGRTTGPHLHYEIRVDGLAVHHHTGEALSNKVLAFEAAGRVSATHVSLKTSKAKASKLGTARIKTRINAKEQARINKKMALEGLKAINSTQKNTTKASKTSKVSTKTSTKKVATRTQLTRKNVKPTAKKVSARTVSSKAKVATKQVVAKKTAVTKKAVATKKQVVNKKR